MLSATSAPHSERISGLIEQTAGQPITAIQVQYNGTSSEVVTVPVSEATPGIFTLNASGTGPGAIVNQDGTINSPSNPAPRSSVVSIYATGSGISNLQLTNGELAGSAMPTA
jgi:uncharacterized protein (TIGR03437 family)